MMRRYLNADDMFIGALDWLRNRPVHESRAGPTLEGIGWCGRLASSAPNFVFNPIRNASPTYAAGELLWYLSGSDDGDFIKHYALNYAHFLDEGKAWGAYGARWKRGDQLRRAVGLLAAQPGTRQCVIVSWSALDLEAITGEGDAPKDIPCTLSLQFIRRPELMAGVRRADGRDMLHLIVTMRSNDLWLGFPNDVWCFSTLQRLLADHLGCSVGEYQHQAGSLHLYEKDFDKAWEAVAAADGAWRPPLEGADFDWLRHTQGTLFTDLAYALEHEECFRVSGGDAALNHLTLSNQLTGVPLGGITALASLRGMTKPQIDAKTMSQLQGMIPNALLTRALEHVKEEDA